LFFLFVHPFFVLPLFTVSQPGISRNQATEYSQFSSTNSRVLPRATCYPSLIEFSHNRARVFLDGVPNLDCPINNFFTFILFKYSEYSPSSFYM
jgi:hypothetical protein